MRECWAPWLAHGTFTVEEIAMRPIGPLLADPPRQRGRDHRCVAIDDNHTERITWEKHHATPVVPTHRDLAVQFIAPIADPFHGAGHAGRERTGVREGSGDPHSVTYYHWRAGRCDDAFAGTHHPSSHLLPHRLWQPTPTNSPPFPLAVTSPKPATTFGPVTHVYDTLVDLIRARNLRTVTLDDVFLR